MRILNYILLTALLVSGCTSLFGEDYSKKSVQELLSLAKQGDAAAQYNLGLAYNNGRGVRKNEQKAFWWWRVAAEHGDPTAQFYLGNMYRAGIGVPQDIQQAFKWYRKAAEQGVAKAQFYLGEMYQNGHGVPQDNVLSHKWFNLAAAQEVKGATRLRDDLAKQMTPSQIQEAQRLAIEFKPKKEKP